MKKIISLLLIFVMSMILFAGCGESSTSDSTDSSSGSSSAANQSEEKETDQGENEENDDTLEMVEPYIAHLGEIVENNSISMSASEMSYQDYIVISGITGSVSLSVDHLGEYIRYISRLKWETSGSYTFEDYEKVREAVINFYDIETENVEAYNPEADSFSCENQYVTIDLNYNLTDEGKNEITILWTLKTDNFDQGRVSCYTALQILKDALRDPDSLQVHDIGYCPMEYADGSGTVYGVHIDYTAKNGLGGNNQGDYYIFIDPATYAEAEAMSSADSLLPDKEFKSANVDDVSSLRVTVKNSVPTIITDNFVLEPSNASEEISDEQINDDLTFLMNRAQYTDKNVQDFSGDIEISRVDDSSDYTTYYFENAYLFGLNGEIRYIAGTKDDIVDNVCFVIYDASYEEATQGLDCLTRVLGTDYEDSDTKDSTGERTIDYKWKDVSRDEVNYEITYYYHVGQTFYIEVMPKDSNYWTPPTK